MSTELGRAVNTSCNIHAIFCSPHREDGRTPVPQRNPADRPASHRHSIWPGKAFISFRLDRLPFLVVSGGVVYDNGLCPRPRGRLQRAGAPARARDEKQATGAPLRTARCRGLRLCSVRLALAPVGKMYCERQRKKMQMKRWLPFGEERALEITRVCRV